MQLCELIIQHLCHMRYRIYICVYMMSYDVVLQRIHDGS